MFSLCPVVSPDSSAGRASPLHTYSGRGVVLDFPATSAARQSKSRPAFHCVVLPPDKFNTVMICPESLCLTVFPYCCYGNKHRNIVTRISPLQ